MAIEVKQNPDNEVPTEILADSIVYIADAMRKIRSGRLNDRAMILLIRDAAPMALTQKQVRAVLDGIGSLEASFIRKAAPRFPASVVLKPAGRR